MRFHRRIAAGVALAVAAALLTLLSPTTAPARAAASKLAVSNVQLSCECGGAGYLWGWRLLTVSFEGGAAKGTTFTVSMKNGPTVSADYSYGGQGAASFARSDGLVPGKTYRFTVKEFRKKKLVATSKTVAYTVPRPVGHPRRAHLDSTTRTSSSGEESEVLVAGQTYHLTFDGEWADDIRFASGVDVYRGTAPDDGRFGYYLDAGYPLPWKTKGTAPIVTFTPTEEFVGTTWSIQVVGYLPSPRAIRSLGLRKGDPIKGTEYGFSFSLPVVAP